MWKFRCYIFHDTNEFRDWFDSLEKAAQGKIYARLMYLRFNIKMRWCDPYVHYLYNSGGFYHIILPYKRIQYRIIGYFDEAKSEFLMLHLYEEKNKSDITRAIECAQRRRKGIIENGDKTEEYYFTNNTGNSPATH